MTALQADRGYRERVRRVHRLGPRPVGELLLEVVKTFPPTRDLVLARLDAYAGLDPGLVALVGGRDWPDQAAVVRLVAGGGT